KFLLSVYANLLSRENLQKEKMSDCAFEITRFHSGGVHWSSRFLFAVGSPDSSGEKNRIIGTGGQ
ncbi:hypothetical protein, partial [Candidatus Contendibacter odensensis]|uniref:hypothetical protein n=1 Tax=Candidatus Contendibacter odensensis TaxID=1400860 RepID=UPI001E514D57